MDLAPDPWNVALTAPSPTGNVLATLVTKEWARTIWFIQPSIGGLLCLTAVWASYKKEWFWAMLATAVLQLCR